MRFQWVNLALVGAASAMHPYLDEAMRGERVHSGYGVYDEPEWVPLWNDESPPYRGVRVPREEWKLSCTTEDSLCKYAIDGTNTTSWNSKSAPGTHNITIDLRDRYAVGAVVVLPPLNLKSEKGLITEHQVFVSNDNETWTGPVAYGMWPNTNRQRLAAFEPILAQYVRLVAVTPERSWVGISEINVYANLYTIPQNPAKGAWGPTIDLPVVPAAAAQEAGGQIMLWSSWDDDQFHSTPGGKTAMARWDHDTKKVTKRVVTDTHHDMFCPGIAIDGTGMMVVTGGNDAAQTSIYNAFTDTWEPGTAMNIERGYQAMTTLSDGRLFVIGGSWAGNSNLYKNGEVYNPATRNWTMLPEAKVEPMYTRDMEGPWRADNHGWLFGWKNRTVLQAGPSVNMNWYGVDGEGRVDSAGERVGGEDSMSGNAVMFDAVAGKILTFGGSPDYDKSWANSYAHIITLGEPWEPVKVEPAGKDGQMTVERVFHTSVVLPDGTVFIIGGQTFGIAFNEENVKFTPELYDPKTNTFTELQKNNLIRVYHSISILAPDATVLTGGGGLCGNCSANHYDAQVFTPPYLLTETGARREQPKFVPFVRTNSFEVGGWIEFRSRSVIKEAALVRISSNTHTVNTDQRRVPLKVKVVGKNWKGVYRYRTELPTDAGIVIPGQWMFFMIDRAGTPSNAEIIHIKSNEKTLLSEGPYAIADDDDVFEQVHAQYDDADYNDAEYVDIESEEEQVLNGDEDADAHADADEKCEKGFFHSAWHHMRQSKLIVQILGRASVSN